jgi:WS/DGAT/MGAT family acyltransferase
MYDTLPTIYTYAHPDQSMKQVTGRDAAYLYLGDHNSSTIISCYLLPNPDNRPLPIGRDDAVAWLRERLTASDLFASKLMRLPGDIGLPYWVPDPDFDPAIHVRFHEAPDWESARDLVAELGAAPLDLNRPLWFMHVIPDITDAPDQPGLSTLVALHYHHIAFDGMLFTRLTAMMFSDVTIDDEIRENGRLVGPADTSRAALTRREVIGMPGQWLRFVRAGISSIRVARAAGRASKTKERKQWPVTRFNTPFRGPRIADCVVLDQDAVLALKSRVPGATVNDLMLSVIGESAVRYLTTRNERPNSSLSALVPISTRAMRESASANQFVPMVIDLQTTEPDLRARVRRISAETSREKKRVADEMTHTPVAVVDVMPAPLLRVLGHLTRRPKKAASASPAFNIVVTNVNGMQMRRKIFGLDVVGGFAVQTVAAGASLAHVVTNRDQKIVLSITADRAVMPDISEYCEIIRESFETHQAELA